MMTVLLALAFAADPPDDLGPVLRDAIARAPTQLTLPDAPDMYHLRYVFTRVELHDARSSLGSLVYADTSPSNVLDVQIRLGSPSFDQLGFGGWQNGLGVERVALDVTPHALAVAAWRLTDQSYKEGVEHYARKRAQVPERPDHPGDYTLIGPVTASAAAPTFAPAGLSELTTRLSAAWLGGPLLDRGDVYVGHEAGTRRIVDNEGSDVTAPILETSVRAAAHLRTADGMMLTDQVLWTVRNPDALPPEADMVAAIEAARDRLAAAAAAPAFDEEYVGPVLFEGEAANDLFRYLLPDQLEGTPSDIPFEAWFGELGLVNDPVRVGRRVLPPGWSVVDDPRHPSGHPGSYTHDAEGTPSERIELVEDGIVRTLAMSRTPRKGLEHGNGHARGGGSQRGVGKLNMMTITADRRVSEAKLRALALKEARAYGRDHVLVVRRLQSPAVQNLSRGGGMMLFGGEEEGVALPPPVAVFRLTADGREELLRGARFASVERFVLRDIVAAGPQVSSSTLSPWRQEWGDLGPVEGVATYTSSPTVLVGEMELVPSSGDPRDNPVLPPPLARD